MKLIEVQIAPYGEYECHDGEKEHEGVKQVVDEAAVDAMVESFGDEVLVDVDHRSIDGSSSEAAAWVTEVWKDAEKGLMGTFKLTSLGEAVIEDGRYKYLSPTWTLDKAGRPEKLYSIGLTNTPNLPVAPLSNGQCVQTFFKNHFFLFKNARSVSDAQGDEKTADASKGRFSKDFNGGENPPSNSHIEPEKERTPEMDKVKEILGLPPEATEDDIAGAVTALKDENAALKDAAAEAEAEDFANENAEKCEDKETLKNAFKANPELTRTLVANMKKIAPVPIPEMAKNPVCNSATAKAPASLKAVAVTNSDMAVKERIAANRKAMQG